MQVLGLSIFAWITIAVVIFKTVMTFRGKMSGDILALIIISVLMLTGTLTQEAALDSFGSPTVVTIGALLVLGASMVHAGVVHLISRQLGTPRTFRKAVTNLMVTVAGMSAFFNSNMITALFINIVKVWSKKVRIPASKLLIPLSYAASLGGLCTIIGSSSNLLAVSFYADETGGSMPFFAPLIPGVACVVTGIVTVVVFQKYLPLRKLPEESFESSDNYTVELMVPTDCRSIGKTIKEAKLQNVTGGHLIEIVRFDKEIISPVPDDEFIFGGDHLVFTGRIDDILQLRTTHGLVNATHHVFSVKELNKNRTLQMATVTWESSLVDHCMADIDFEKEHDVVLIAIAREGEHIKDIPRETMIRPGDTLLFEGSRMDTESLYNDLLFFDTVALPQQGKKTYMSMVIMLCMVLLSAFRVMPLLYSALLAAGAMLITHCCSAEQMRRAINWKIVMVFAGSVCIGKAIEVTGLANVLGNSIADTFGFSPLLTLFMFCLIATILTEFISNATAAAVLIPIAIETAEILGANTLTFVVALMISISSAFATPIGNETNTMVYGPGGYKFSDFMKLGLLMNIVILITNIVATCLVYPIEK